MKLLCVVWRVRAKDADDCSANDTGQTYTPTRTKKIKRNNPSRRQAIQRVIFLCVFVFLCIVHWIHQWALECCSMSQRCPVILWRWIFFFACDEKAQGLSGQQMLNTDWRHVSQKMSYFQIAHNWIKATFSYSRNQMSSNTEKLVCAKTYHADKVFSSFVSFFPLSCHVNISIFFFPRSPAWPFYFNGKALCHNSIIRIYDSVFSIRHRQLTVWKYCHIIPLMGWTRDAAGLHGVWLLSHLCAYIRRRVYVRENTATSEDYSVLASTETRDSAVEVDSNSSGKFVFTCAFLKAPRADRHDILFKSRKAISVLVLTDVRWFIFGWRIK